MIRYVQIHRQIKKLILNDNVKILNILEKVTKILMHHICYIPMQC